MRVHTESKVRLAGPILQIMARVVQSDTMIHRTREVRNFILPYAAAFQARACGEVEVSGKVVVGNKMRMVATASGQQFVSKPRLLVHFQHVHADMRNTGCQGFAERKAPALFRLMRQASDQVEVDVSYPARSQPRARSRNCRGSHQTVVPADPARAPMACLRRGRSNPPAIGNPRPEPPKFAPQPQVRRTPAPHNGRTAPAKIPRRRSCRRCTSCGKTVPRCKVLATRGSRKSVSRYYSGSL